MTGKKGLDTSEGTSVTKRNKFLKNDINSAPLLSTMIKRIPNPETGQNFSNISEAKDYYKRQYKRVSSSETTTTTNKPKQVIQNGVTYTLNPTTGQYE